MYYESMLSIACPVWQKLASLQAKEIVCSFRLKGSQMNLPSGQECTGGECFSSIGSTLEAQEEWTAVMTRHDPVIVLPSDGNQTSIEESIQLLDFSFVEMF